MFQALASQANWVGTLSNWALGTTGIYVGLLVTNYDAIVKHLPEGFQLPVFWFGLISACVGIWIQVMWGIVQFSLSLENQVTEVMIRAITIPPDRPFDPGYPAGILEPVLDEFVNSRPWLFRRLAQWGREKGKTDLVMVSKRAANSAQIMFGLLLLQYVLLGFAVFWPLGVVSLTSNRPPIGSLSTTPTPAAKASVSKKPSPPARTTWIP
jgi:hypothetical protein